MEVCRPLVLAVLLFHVVTGQTRPRINSTVLVNGNATAGRVEVMVDGVWSTVCDDNWDSREATVVCRSLGLSGGTAYSLARFGQGNPSWPILVDDTECTGSEASLGDCYFVTGSNVNCDHGEDASVVCGPAPAAGQTTPAPVTTTPQAGATLPTNCTQGTSQSVRFFGIPGLQGAGYVQVRTDNGTWGFVCDDGLDINVAKTVCKELCYTDMSIVEPGIKTEYQVAITNPLIVQDDTRCSGTETQLVRCAHAPFFTSNCGPTELMTVSCVQPVYTTPQPPIPILQCLNDSLLALFNKSWDQNLDLKFLTIADPYTGDCNLVKDSAGDFFSLKIPLQQCGTKVTQNATHIIYRNAILVSSTSTILGLVTRSNTYRVELECDVPRNASVNKYVQPLTETVTQKTLGQFVVTLTLYTDMQFSNPVVSYPYQITLGSWINAAVELQSADSRLKLVVTDCFSTPNASYYNSSNMYSLYKTKCVVKDSTLEVYPLSLSKFAMRLQPVLFVGKPTVALVCNAIVCLDSEVTQECDRSCNNSKPVATRRRRAAESRPVYTVTTDIINIVVTDEPVTDLPTLRTSTTSFTSSSSSPTSIRTSEMSMTTTLAADQPRLTASPGATATSANTLSAGNTSSTSLPVTEPRSTTLAVMEFPKSGAEGNGGGETGVETEIHSVGDGNSASSTAGHSTLVVTLHVLVVWLCRPFLH
ncbi:deleted in malignant brain tumors 1 protein-like [Pomacea canaliculata]|uniref:deleted in malignant brain tumors 1 protein-like n=1 Tax=Pomacea canaliculata TaxID=400727 RepID=UPI000D73DFEF|nr:deleted in malignant brain tumors 1 protein-like [Pomacea canaliculata]